MASKLFVGNLEYSVTGDDLKAAFAGVGTVVDAVVISDKMTGRSRGFGFVEMSSEEEVKAAIEKMNGADLKGRKINVNEARPPREPQG
ncbi:RNA-binding protein [Candidatus Woesebacteria bacterium RIFCSPHIGHO2_12_FULL_42_9]|uniref:RNA-binding protein n=3 Tax=Candidatus Woeseibacteriota TaxID=1752722 RepID=A0A1F8AXQ5_9BACT|nr:MAG: Glycine-rich RNA-binding protein 8 [Candidatus Woesebacteria bacterium GW2011_GWA1_39_12]OGM06281.1 MAG: RNA-binding protein [Candidatus Woesebacteria bacterium GWC1_42_13]OGM56543.1 MAG: RNA-binding protein [Candidatus Woesebacteria bacterium RIFCSPHIGHO2_12_FULL_42_9]